jgi:CHAT domain-containing protein
MTAAGPCRLSPFEPLPATVRELAEIEELLPHARVITGAAATKARLRQELARGPAILHLATHAYFAGLGECPEPSRAGSLWRDAGGPVAANPLLLSGIVFAGANGTGRVSEGEAAERASGILTAYEAAGLDLSSARLVVLSACDTGTGLHQRGQEVQGLRWGFRASGAGALVTSLWRSNDVATRKLMRSFYRTLLEAGSQGDLFSGAEALRSAQLERVGDERRLGVARPLVWANFVFSGVL